ncbi:MAG TPA: IS21 family transposase [Bryobacteraceae bacterium]|nr:IS21 family transposase [Bryobacteraceae bacterium]
MLTNEQIQTLHQLYYAERWPIRKIERHLRMGWRTIKKYLHRPDQPTVSRTKPSKLDPFKPTIADLLGQDPTVSSAVIEQRLRTIGYDGGHSILREYVSQVRPKSTPRAFVRMEPIAGERFEVDWGHFGALDYAGDKRKLYAFALVECHSRMLYLEFTHSQGFETFVRCHLHAFQMLGGTSREIWYDNLATAVAEHDGRLVRFQPRFFAFAREFGFVPRACNPAAGWEKGKVERAGVGYVRQNFWPLRSFADLDDVNRQARQWLTEVANQRQHRETRQRPIDRFQPQALRPLPALLPDYRDVVDVLVHKDIRIHFDGNRYCAPPSLVGEHLLLKADAHTVALYHQQRQIVTYPRCWRRGQTFGAERFEKELLAEKAAAARSQAQQRLIALLETHCPRLTVEEYLRGMADNDRSLSRQVSELLELIRLYGSQAVAQSLVKAHAGRAFGSDYVANILRQQQSPRAVQPRLRLNNPELDQLATDPLSLLEYDALLLPERNDSDEHTPPETGTTQPDDDEPPSGSNDR